MDTIDRQGSASMESSMVAETGQRKSSQHSVLLESSSAYPTQKGVGSEHVDQSSNKTAQAYSEGKAQQVTPDQERDLQQVNAARTVWQHGCRKNHTDGNCYGHQCAHGRYRHSYYPHHIHHRHDHGHHRQCSPAYVCYSGTSTNVSDMSDIELRRSPGRHCQSWHSVQEHGQESDSRFLQATQSIDRALINLNGLLEQAMSMVRNATDYGHANDIDALIHNSRHAIAGARLIPPERSTQTLQLQRSHRHRQKSFEDLVQIITRSPKLSLRKVSFEVLPKGTHNVRPSKRLLYAEVFCADMFTASRVPVKTTAKQESPSDTARPWEQSAQLAPPHSEPSEHDDRVFSIRKDGYDQFSTYFASGPYQDFLSASNQPQQGSEVLPHAQANSSGQQAIHPLLRLSPPHGVHMRAESRYDPSLQRHSQASQSDR